MKFILITKFARQYLLALMMKPCLFWLETAESNLRQGETHSTLLRPVHRGVPEIPKTARSKISTGMKKDLLLGS